MMGTMAQDFLRELVQIKSITFHEEEGCQLLEFHSHEMFLRCVDQYSGMQYRYQ